MHGPRSLQEGFADVVIVSEEEADAHKAAQAWKEAHMLAEQARQYASRMQFAAAKAVDLAEDLEAASEAAQEVAKKAAYRAEVAFYKKQRQEEQEEAQARKKRKLEEQEARKRKQVATSASSSSTLRPRPPNHPPPRPWPMPSRTHWSPPPSKRPDALLSPCPRGTSKMVPKMAPTPRWPQDSIDGSKDGSYRVRTPRWPQDSP